MKYILFFLFVQSSIIGIAQTTEVNTITLKKAFENVSSGTRNDTCTTQDVIVEIIFSGNVQRVLPKRAQRLNEVIGNCGINSKQDWTKGTTELSVFEDDIRYWLQLEPAAADEILSKYRLGDKLIIYGQVITEHSSTPTSFLIVSKLTLQEQNGY
jgi:hypothetical protein